MPQAERTKPLLVPRADLPSAPLVPLVAQVPPWASPPPGLTAGQAWPSVPKARLPPTGARTLPIGAAPPVAADPEDYYELVLDEPPVAAPVVESRPAQRPRTPIGAPPPSVSDLELDDDAEGVGTDFPRRGWRIPRDGQGAIDLDAVRPDVDGISGDIAAGYPEPVAIQRQRDRARAARHKAVKWYKWQVLRGIVPPDEGAQAAATPKGPPSHKGSASAQAQGSSGKGLPLDRSRTPQQSKGTGGKGRGAGSQPAGKGGKKGAHSGRGEHSRYVGYSGTVDISEPSASFRDSVPAGQGKAGPPKGTPFAAEGTGTLSGPVPASEYVPSYLSNLSAEDLAEERKREEDFLAFLDTFPSGSQPATPGQTLLPVREEDPLPGAAPLEPEAPVPLPGSSPQPAKSDPTVVVRQDMGPASTSRAAGERAQVGEYPPIYQAASAIDIASGAPPAPQPPPPPPPTA